MLVEKLLSSNTFVSVTKLLEEDSKSSLVYGSGTEGVQSCFASVAEQRGRIKKEGGGG